MSDTDRKLATTAVALAEVSRDLLGFAARDAGDLADLAQQFVGYVMTNDDSLTRAFQLAAATAEHAARVRSMIEKIEPGLAELVAMDGQAQRTERGEHAH